MSATDQLRQILNRDELEMITMDERTRVTQKDKLDALEKRYVTAA